MPKVKRFDDATLRKLHAGDPPTERQPDNGATTPSTERIREAVREANDPKRLVSPTPGYYSPSRAR